MEGALIAAVVVSLPLMYRTTRGAFELLDSNIIYAARTLGVSEWKIFWRILLPNARGGILAGVVLSFTRAMGEFGATIMFAGNVPGKTQTMSTAIYAAVQANDYDLAFKWAILLAALSLIFIFAMNSVVRNTKNFFHKPRYSRCASVSVSIFTPIDSSLISAILELISSGMR